MTNQEYHEKKHYLSKSSLDILAKSPAHFKNYLDAEKKDPTAAMIFGSLVHAVVFNEETYIVAPECDRRTTIGKAIYAEFLYSANGKELIVTAEQYEQACLIRDAVYAHSKAALLLSEGHAEIPVFGTLANQDVRCKADFLNTKYNAIVDLKTTNDSSPFEFSKSVYNYRYHVQAALYMDLMNVKRFFFIAVEKEAPFNVEIYELDNESIEIGRAEYLANIELYKKCMAENNWPSYTGGQDINMLSLPKWAK